MSSCKYNDFDSILIQSLTPVNIDQSLLSSQQSQDHTTTGANNNQRTQLLKEENKIEREILKLISTGKHESLKPNSGEAIAVGEHYVCVSFHEEIESDCRVWEWHGHVVSYSEEGRGYTQEYVYGSYFERMMKKVIVEESDGEEIDQEVDFGLREFIGGLNLMDGRLFCGNSNDNSRRV